LVNSAPSGRIRFRDVKTRLRDIGEARIALQNAGKEPEVAANAASTSRFAWMAWPAGVFLLTTLGLSLLHFREMPPAEPRVVRFTIPLPEKGILGPFLSLSPDGRRLAFSVSGEGSTRLWVRALDSLQSHPLVGTEGTGGVPFWSFDSRNIVFWMGGKLKKIDVSGGPPQTLCDVPLSVYRGFWTRDNRIVFGSATGVFQIAAGGGVPSPLTTVDGTRQETYHGVPALLPDARHFVFQRFAPASVENGGIYLASLDAKPDAQGLKRLLPDQSMPFYVPSLDPVTPNAGYLIFVREGTLMAQPFDAARLELSGDAIPIAERVGAFGAYSVSETGTLVYAASGSSERRLTWYDRHGKVTGTAWIPRQYSELNLSPDGSRVAIEDQTSAKDVDIWVFEFARDVSTRLTNGHFNFHPVWSSDGSRIVYSSTEGSGFQMLVKSASGTGKEDLLRKSNSPMYSNDWSRDGRFLLFQENDTRGKNHLWFLPIVGERKPTPYLHSEFNENAGQFSPDGRFVTYVSDQSGSDEVYVSSFPEPNAVRLPISHGGGYQPRWRRDGKELLYFSGDGMIMSVDVTLSPVLKVGVPKALFQAPVYTAGSLRYSGGREYWDIAPDGQRFLINTISGDASATLTVVLNWQAALKR
jgi:eukaryotic-like serine/threonine-protein kinase